MAFRQKRHTADAKPLTLSDGTEVYEVTQSFSVNTLIDISFNRPRPIRPRQQQILQELDSYIVEEHVNAELAKLNYVGCSFDPPDNAINKSIDDALNSEHGKLYKDPSKYYKLDEEIPAVTYRKLTEELEQFAIELSEYDAKNEGDDGNIKLLTTGIQTLNNSLKELKGFRKYKTILANHYRPHDRVNIALNQKIHDIKNPDREEEEDHGDYISRMYGDREGAWILYGQKKTVQTLGTADAQFLDLEARLSTLEQTVGYVTDMKNPYPDTLNAVDLLESRFEYVLGGPTWDKIRGHAGNMTSNLKNIKYHLDLMQARYKPQEKQTRVEWEKLEDIWIMMNQWDHVVFELINIVKRLKSLQNYHYRTCLFINRVNKIYSQQELIYRSLKQDERTLKRCMESMEANTKLMENNASLMEQKMRVLQSKLSPVAMQAAAFDTGN